MTLDQRRSFVGLMLELRPDKLVHGDCIGADTEAHIVAVLFEVGVRIRPCDITGKRSHCTGFEWKAEPEAPLDRNQKIVEDCDILIATPKGPEERRSGTWSTIRRARKLGRPIAIIWPDGTIERENES